MDDQSTITAESTEPTQEAKPEIPEPSEPTQAAQSTPVIDLERARARLAELHAQEDVLRMEIAEGELAEAQAGHDLLLERCNAAQTAFDEIDRKVIAQQHSFFAASNRRKGAASQIDMHRRNLPKRSYDKSDRLAWEKELSRLEAEQGTANAEFGPISAALITLQAERTAAQKALSDLSFIEGQARVRVANLQQRLAQMKPAVVAPNQMRPMLNGSTLEYTNSPLPRSAY